jgi:hypothetical protein
MHDDILIYDTFCVAVATVPKHAQNFIFSALKRTGIVSHFRFQGWRFRTLLVPLAQREEAAAVLEETAANHGFQYEEY